MSMIGNFLAVSQEELESVLAEPSAISSLLYDVRHDEVMDIDKAWHGIHFLLTGSPFGGTAPLANVVFGTTQVGEEDVGYGPALATPSAEVHAIAAAVAKISEDDFRARFDVEAMGGADIYPQIWAEGDEALDYLTTYFKQLQTFYRAAADEGKAVITFIN